MLIRRRNVVLLMVVLAASIAGGTIYTVSELAVKPAPSLGKRVNVAVTNAEPPAQSVAASGDESLAPVEYKNDEALLIHLKKIGIERAMANLVESSGGGSVFDCHQEAHQIGRIGYRIETEKAFQSCDANCHSGCYHGAMEAFLSVKGTANLAANIDAVCGLFDTSFGIFECLHGVGHGILAYVDYDIPEAIRDCDKLKDSFSQTSCYGGMFMENILTGQGLGASEDAHETPWVNRADPYFPCNGIDQDYALQYQCYQMQTSWMLSLVNYNFDTVAGFCLGAPENMKSVCFKSFGRDASGHTLRNPDRIVELCNKVPKQSDYYERCIDGAVNVIVDFWGPGLKGQASELCSKLEEPHKAGCYRILAGRLIGLFNSDALHAVVCNTFEPEYQHLCRAR